MAEITLKGNPIHTSGQLPALGSKLPAFTLTSGGLEDVNLDSFSGKKLVLNIFPSLDTGTCAQSVRSFNQKAGGKADVDVLCISADLPFAQGRFCGAEGIEGVTTLSTFRNPKFGEDYGLVMTDGPLKGLMSRVVIVADESGTVLYTEQVPEIAQEPNYDGALAAL